jgi:hypothetical protein
LQTAIIERSIVANCTEKHATHSKDVQNVDV